MKLPQGLRMEQKCHDSASKFRVDGFTVDDVFFETDLELFVDTFKALVVMQCKKLNIFVTNDIYRDVQSLNDANSRALSEVLAMARNTSSGHLLASNRNLLEKSSEFLESPKELLIVSGPSFFVNFQSNNERKYTWHSEQNWYPKRRNFLNVWCPIIEERITDNSMAIMRGSHLKDWFYFSEYVGYDGVPAANANVQYEIPSSFLSGYAQDIPRVKIGQGIFFDGKLVHRSIDNSTPTPYFTLVFRVFDYSNDLTLSSNWADLPYNGKSLGFPEINVQA
jgi:hypothetical protein